MELKPCPCGGEARYSTIKMYGNPRGDKGYLTEIFCCKCKQGVKKWALEKDRSIKSATEAWNEAVRNEKTEEEKAIWQNWKAKHFGAQRSSRST